MPTNLQDTIHKRGVHINKYFLADFANILKDKVLLEARSLRDACEILLDGFIEQNGGLTWLYFQVNGLTSWHSVAMLFDATVEMEICKYSEGDHPEDISKLDKELPFRVFIEDKISYYLENVSNRKCTSDSSDLLY